MSVAEAVGGSETTPLIVNGDQDAEKNELVARVDVIRHLEIQRAAQESPLRRILASFGSINPLTLRVIAVAGGVLFVGLMGTAIYLSIQNPTSTELICRPTQVPSVARQGFILTDPRLLVSNATFIPSEIVAEEVYDDQESFERYEKLALHKWKYLDSKLEAKTAAALDRKSQVLAEDLTTCLTGEIYGSQPFHATMAEFLRLPFSPTNKFDTLLITLRAQNQNFSQPISNALFVETMERFTTNAWNRNHQEMLDEKRNWFMANFDSWISTVKNVLNAYTKSVSNSFFKDLDPAVTATIGHQPGFIELAYAPPRDQVVGLQQVQAQVMNKICGGGLEDKELEDLLELDFAITADAPYAQYSALTGKSYYARMGDNPFKIVPFDETSVGLFKWLYWFGYGQDAAYQFKQLWENGLQYYIDQGTEGFEEEPVQNLVYALQSVAESRNGTVICWRHDPRPDQVVDMHPALELIRNGVRFGNETWRPIQTHVS